MQIVRTAAVELSTIPAIAFKQKLSSGGAGIKLIRTDREAHAVFTIDRRTGDGVPYGPVDAKFFPQQAVEEAIEMTVGMPYTKRGKLSAKNLHDVAEKDEEDVAENDDHEALSMVDSDEYKAVLDRYCNENGKLNHALMNKDFIQFASKSKVVSDMVASGALEDDIIRFIIKSRATMLANKKESMSDRETDALMETLDEIDPRSAFKELRAYVRRLLARR